MFVIYTVYTVCSFAQVLAKQAGEPMSCTIMKAAASEPDAAELLPVDIALPKNMCVWGLGQPCSSGVSMHRPCVPGLMCPLLCLIRLSFRALGLSAACRHCAAQ